MRYLLFILIFFLSILFYAYKYIELITYIYILFSWLSTEILNLFYAKELFDPL